MKGAMGKKNSVNRDAGGGVGGWKKIGIGKRKNKVSKEDGGGRGKTRKRISQKNKRKQ